MKRFMDVVERLGQPQVTLLSRLVEWFCDRDEEFQDAVAMRGDAVRKLAQAGLAEMISAGEVDPGSVKTIEDAAEVIRLMLKRIKQIDDARIRQLAGKTKS